MAEMNIDPIFGKGQPNDAYAEYFIGQSYLQPLTSEGVSIANVTFEPGCRNNWHIHHASSGGGQILLCVAGSGWHQIEGQEPESMEPGSVAQVPAGVKHWHGAKAGSWFTHIAIAVPGENLSNEWLEPVTDDIYTHLNEKRSDA
ncbi:cupin domain-containing protein [Kribbia dieselivorans]|uniref:cupin domain-containing protein n=1 Tax=Kribbia dieselivorans TaxID=331526 RepID=UPI000838D01B|nr:cupin domain-containing protein [Kribbia dieselivorans]